MSAAVDRAVALGAQQVLEQHLQRERQARDVEALLQRVEAEDLVLAPADLRACPWRQSCSATSASPGDRAGLQAASAVSQSRRGATARDACGAAQRERARTARVTRPLPWRLERSSAASQACEQLVGAHRRAATARRRSTPRRRSAAVRRADRAQALERARRRPPRRSSQVGVGEDHDELVAAVARDAVERAELAHERLHDLAQHRVAGLVAVVVVDELEVVEVDQQARERPAGAHRAADLLVQAPAHRAVVHAAGHRVGARLGARAHERERRRRLIDERRCASSTARWRRSASETRRTSITTASTSPRSASGSSSAQLIAPGRGQARHARGELLARRRRGSCARCAPPSSPRAGARRAASR